ncbi:MAG: TetR family transcriptional regulator [Actinomycetota bacterium]
MLDVGTHDGATGDRGPVEARRSRRREELLERAIDAIRDLGPAATMEQLASAGDVTKPILYRHFGDRDGLIEAIAEHFAQALFATLVDSLQTSAEPRLLLDQTVAAYVAYVEADPDLYWFLVQRPHPRGEHRTPIGPLVDRVAPRVAEVVGERMAELGQDPAAALPWAYGIVGLVHQATQWWLRDAPMPREAFVGHLTDLLWGGLSTSVGSPT